MPSDTAVVKLIRQHGMAEAARLLNLGLRSLNRRRRQIELRTNQTILTPVNNAASKRYGYSPHAGRIEYEIQDGIILVGGDCHYTWITKIPLMHKAFVSFCKEYKPKAVVLNGDICDFSAIGRHARIGWEARPFIDDELDAAKERLSEIEKAAFKAHKFWPLGNHDSRFNTCLANEKGGERYEGVPGFSLQDHFSLWQHCWRVDINKSDVVVKHRDKGGKHEAYNNAIHWGCTAITGHTHNPYVRGINDVRGRRWCVNHGCIADPDDPCFLNWTEDRPSKDWHAAFAF